jgi:hypothetical protein
MVKALLIITVLGVGGPPGVASRPIKNASVRITHNGKLIGRSHTGSLRVRVSPGPYQASAALERACQTRRVAVKHDTVKVTLYCSIK